MNYRLVGSFLGNLLIYLGLLMLLPCAVALFLGEHDAAAFLWSAGVTMLVGLLLRQRGITEEISHRDAFAMVTVGWLSVAVFGSLPFQLAGTFAPTLSGWVDGFFEAMSGVTTTGATVITDLTAQPHGILLWRSFLQWLGGMGFIVLSIAILPKLGVGGMELFKAEIPSPIPERLRPRIRQTALILWKIYVALTVILFVLLWLAGMNVFDAILHALSTMPTGGFSNYTSSEAVLKNGWIEAILVVFMILGGINFSLYYRAQTARHWRDLFWNEELRAYLGIIVVGTALITLNLWRHGTMVWWEAIRHGLFHVVSVTTTTGFVTENYDLWPAFATAVLFLLMFSGGMAGSTSGSIKVLRHLIVVKHIAREILRLLHPRSIRTVTIGDQTIDERVISGVISFVLLFLLLFGIGTAFMTTQGLDLRSAAAATAAMLTNVGPGLGMVGPVENYAFIPSGGKLFLSFLMLTGRLEIYGVLVLLLPAAWEPSRRKRETPRRPGG